MTPTLKIVLRSFLYRKKRTFLTMLGIIIGTTLILTLVLLGEGLERALSSQLQAFGGDLIFAMPGTEDDPLAGLLSGGEVSDDDIRVIEDVRGVEMVMGMAVQDLKTEYRGEEKIVNVSGSPWEETRIIFEGSQGFDLADGDWPARDDLNQAVLGDLIARDTFARPVRPGEEIIIGNRRFLVTGIFKSLGNADDDARIYISLDRFRVLTGKRTGVNFAVIKVAPGLDVEGVTSDIRYELDRRRGTGDITLVTSDSAIEIIGNVLGIVQLVLAAFAAVALIVGGIGIMNTMFTSVLERTREIGVMKALGATNRRILTLFLTEAGLLGLVGGLFGVLASYGLGKAIEKAAASQNFGILELEFDPVIVLAALGFTFVIGAAFGALPAWRASRLRPTEALRYE